MKQFMIYLFFNHFKYKYLITLVAAHPFSAVLYLSAPPLVYAIVDK